MAKLVLREIAGRYLPREVALLPKKGFGMPASVFLNNVKAVPCGRWARRSRP